MAKEILDFLHGAANISIREDVLSFVAVIPVMLDHGSNSLGDKAIVRAARHTQYASGMKALVLSAKDEWRERIKEMLERDEGVVTEEENTKLLQIGMYLQEKRHKFDVIITDGRSVNQENNMEVLRLLSTPTSGFSIVKTLPLIIADIDDTITETERNGYNVVYPNLWLPQKPLTQGMLYEAMDKAFQYNVRRIFAEDYTKSVKTVLIVSESSRTCDIIAYLASQHFCECFKTGDSNEAIKLIRDEQGHVTTVISTDEGVERIIAIGAEIRARKKARKRRIRFVLISGNFTEEEQERMCHYGVYMVLPNVLDLHEYFSQN